MPWTDEGRERAVDARVQVRREQQAAHDALVRPWFEMARSMGLKGNGLVDFLEANDVPTPGGSRWSRMTARRIQTRLGL